jgi:hypothetical protein
MVSMLGLLKANYPNFSQNDADTAKLWWTAFHQYQEQSFEVAVKKHMDNSPYAPKISDIKNLLSGGMNPLYQEMLESLSPPITKAEYFDIATKHNVLVTWEEDGTTNAEQLRGGAYAQKHIMANTRTSQAAQTRYENADENREVS